MKILKVKLPAHLTSFSHPKLFLVGGQARVILFCLIHKTPYPSNYKPRDEDWMAVVGGEKVGIVGNKGKVGCDILLVSSLEDYFDGIDLFTNQVAIKGNTLYTTKKCLDCFVSGVVRINPFHPKITLGGFNGWQYLAMRACIQTGYDVDSKTYYYREAALKLSSFIACQLNPTSLRTHWYYKTYRYKMEQIRLGNH
tara:strand:+ start:823 stop:1410 length:588 start_codon:yes stop_codon:yes gene_type:complete